MKVVKKKMKKPLIIAILAAVLAVLVASIFIINALINKNSSSGTDSKNPVVVDEALGESVYNSSAVAYPHVTRLDMKWIEISGGEDDQTYGFIWDDTYENHIIYKAENDSNEIYLPKILAEFWGDAEYSDFYAIEPGDSYKMPKLFYLCSGIGTLYFNDKFAITSTNEEDRERELAVYGLAKENSPITIAFTYDSDGKAETTDDIKKHTITLGKQLIYGQGYYYMVDGRDFVYTTNGTQIGYATLGYIDYINPLLVAEGLAADNAFEPSLTTDYKQWKNEVYENDGKLDGNPDKVQDGSVVNITADTYVPMPETPSENDTDKVYGYLSEENESLSFDLEEIAESETYKKLVTLLSNSYVGTLEKSVPMTLFTYSNLLEFKSDDEVLKYKYKVLLVEAIITDGADVTSYGTSVATNNLIKVTYTMSVQGEDADEKIRHAVIDLSSSLIPDSAKEALRAAKLGVELASPVEFEISYNTDNAVQTASTMVITGIIGIKKTESGEIIDKVEDGCTVVFNYYFIVNGKAQDKVYTTTIEINDSLTIENRKIADAMMDKEISTKYKIEVDLLTSYEIFADFTAYTIKSIDCFVVKEPIVSFEFVQASQRDPYYGETFYKNTLSNKNSLYALNSANCESVVAILGGLLESATASTGLQGSKVVDLNITPAKLQKYGLYANMIYFELPRNITVTAPESSDFESYLTDLEDYTYYGTLGFTLYISDVVTENGETKRYIASDLYDVIAEIDEEDLKNFVFLDQTFLDFYARKNMVLTNISNISNLKMEFNLSDFFGTFNSELYHEWLYVYDGKVYRENQLTEEQLELATKQDFITVYQTIMKSGTETELSKLFEKEGISGITLREFYDKVQMDGSGDFIGTEHFKNYIEMLFYTFYAGTLTEEEQAAEADLIEEGKYLMRMTVSLGAVQGYKYSYVYEFYRISDRRVMVRLYKTDASTGEMVDEAVSDFYISTFAFKKLVSGYMGLMNKEGVDNNIAYS